MNDMKIFRCSISFPLLKEQKFMGFTIQKNFKTSIFLEYNKDYQENYKLLSFLEENNPVDINLLDESEYGYSCFRCFTQKDLSPEIINRTAYTAIEFQCTNWIEGYNITSANEPFTNKAIIRYPFIEDWFEGRILDDKFNISDELDLIVHSCYTPFGNERIKGKALNCSFEFVFSSNKSINEIQHYEHLLWLFLRFALNIAIPRGRVFFDNGLSRFQRFEYHFKHNENCIENYVNPVEYINSPITIKEIINNPSLLKNGIDFCSKNYHAMTMLSRSMNKKSLIDERIAHLVQVFDGITTNTLKKKNCKRLADRLAKQVAKLEKAKILPKSSFEGNSLSKLLKDIRNAFSHLEEALFNYDSIVEPQQYLELEKIIREINLELIKSEIGFYDM